jgi:putative hydrolase of the HAD superfamily
MARDMLMDALRRRDLGVLNTIRHYRNLRERLGDDEIQEFEPQLLARTAAATGRSEANVRCATTEWIEIRPLSYLPTARYLGVAELFAGLRRHGKIVGIVSDYPAEAKLAVMGLDADFVVNSTDPDVAVLKPHPRGLERLMERAGVPPAATLMLGDRAERDGLAARRAGARCLIRSSKPQPGWQTFARFDDPVFAPMTSA